MRADAFPTVLTSSGRVRGRQEEGLAVFRGIPFAAAPTGENRFMAPRAADAWDGVRDAGEFGPSAPQQTPEPMAVAGDEWLTVNVWTPEPDPAAQRPVMVFIHGGAYLQGSSAQPTYSGRLLASEGGVVLVTLNYRLGMEGFAAIEGAPANRGLLDQVAALTWVRENIAVFGGNPERVTVFGESAGAGSVAALLAMPTARGLFRRAITQSVPGAFLSAELAADVGRELASGLGVRPTVEELGKIEPGTLATAGAVLGPRVREFARRWGRLAYTVTPFFPVIDGEVLPYVPFTALADGAARDVELVVGHNRDEFRLFEAMLGQLGKVTAEQTGEMLRMLGSGADPEGAYRAAFPGASDEALFEWVQSDWLFRIPSLRLAEAQIVGGGRAHVYEMTYPAPANGGVLGSCHGLDVPLVFGIFGAEDTSRMMLGDEPPAEALAISAWWRRAWTTFAESGDPGWPTYAPQERATCVIDVERAVAAYPEEVSRQLWKEHRFDALPLAG
ncbi:carboxylesterase/lipase family protein [Streptomyces sp. S6]